MAGRTAISTTLIKFLVPAYRKLHIKFSRERKMVRKNFSLESSKMREERSRYRDNRSYESN